MRFNPSFNPSLFYAELLIEADIWAGLGGVYHDIGGRVCHQVT